MVWRGPTWVGCWWSSVWLRVRSPMCWNSTWRHMTTQNSNLFFHGMAFGWVSRALTISWSRPFDPCGPEWRSSLKALHECLSYSRFVVDLIDTQYNPQNRTTWWEERWPICPIFLDFRWTNFQSAYFLGCWTDYNKSRKKYPQISTTSHGIQLSISPFQKESCTNADNIMIYMYRSCIDRKKCEREREREGARDK